MLWMKTDSLEIGVDWASVLGPQDEAQHPAVYAVL